MVLCRNASFAFQQPSMLLIHIVSVQIKGEWYSVHLKSWEWYKRTFECILKKIKNKKPLMQCFETMKLLEEKNVLSSSDSAANP